MDPFGYIGAELPALAAPRDRYSPDREEMYELLQELRSTYGRRRLFRTRDVADAIEGIRRRKRDATPERMTPKTVKRLHVSFELGAK